MSMGSQKTTSQAIPTTRRITINDAAHMPHDYSTTPGGTLFSTTPGGTRIIYDRKFLLDCRSSPLARTPPCCLPDIPGVTSPPSVTKNNDKAHPKKTVNNNSISPQRTRVQGRMPSLKWISNYNGGPATRRRRILL